MSMLPLHTFPGAIFLEARMLAQPSTIVSQIGVSIDAPECSVALLSKTSGVLLVAGVGSYCAYRVCTKFLGQRFVWMLLESSRTDSLASADRRLLYECSLPLSPEVDEGDRTSEDEWRERISTSRPASQISRSSRFRQSSRARGLLALRHSHRPREGVLSRRSNASVKSGDQRSISGDQRSIFGDQRSISGDQRSVSGDQRSISGDQRSVSPSCSDRSASLRIVWEGGQDWDDEFANAPGPSNPSFRRMAPSQCGSIAAPSVGDLCSVFDDVMSVTSALDHCQEEVLLENQTELSEEDESHLSHIKCMTDSKYMYHSVLAGSEFGSECGSVVSAMSNLMLLRKKNNNSQQGLWGLSDQEPSTSQTMTDSGLTRSVESKKSYPGRSMFDSAIGADMLSSEDEETGHSRFPLNALPELDSISIAPSEMSMEWFDDGLRTTADVNQMRQDLDWDLDSNYNRTYQEDPIGVSPMHRPTCSRDLMAFACQQYQPYSPQFKLLHNLYHRRRLKKLGNAEAGEGAEKQMRLFLSSALYHKCRIVKDSSWEQLEQRLDRCLKECDYLQRWKGKTEKEMKRQLRTLWDMAENPLYSATDEHLKGLQVLLTLEAKEAYDAKLAGKDLKWFRHDSPATVMHILEENRNLDECSWILLTRCCHVALELFDVNSASLTPIRIGDAPTALCWLKLGASTLPLYFVPYD